MVGRRRTKAESETIQSQVFDLRDHGLSFAQIGQELGITPALASYHHRQFLSKRAEEADQTSAQQRLAAAIERHQRDRAFALGQREEASTSYQSRCWHAEARMAQNHIDKLMLACGLLRKAPDRIEMDIDPGDVRNMSIEEIRVEQHRLQRELAYATVRGIDPPPMEDHTNAEGGEEWAWFDDSNNPAGPAEPPSPRPHLPAPGNGTSPDPTASVPGAVSRWTSA